MYAYGWCWAFRWTRFHMGTGLWLGRQHIDRIVQIVMVVQRSLCCYVNVYTENVSQSGDEMAKQRLTHEVLDSGGPFRWLFCVCACLQSAEACLESEWDGVWVRFHTETRDANDSMTTSSAVVHSPHHWVLSLQSSSLLGLHELGLSTLDPTAKYIPLLMVHEENLTFISVTSDPFLDQFTRKCTLWDSTSCQPIHHSKPSSKSQVVYTRICLMGRQTFIHSWCPLECCNTYAAAAMIR
jgi:hypothetical protein